LIAVGAYVSWRWLRHRLSVDAARFRRRRLPRGHAAHLDLLRKRRGLSTLIVSARRRARAPKIDESATPAARAA